MEESKLIAIRIDELLRQNIVTYNLYLKLSDSKYVIIAKAGTNLSAEYMNRLRAKGVELLYATADEYNSMLTNSLNMTTEVLRSSGVGMSPKISMLISVSEAVFTELEQVGINRECFVRVKANTDNILTLAASGYPLEAYIKEMSNKQGGAAIHALQVAIVAAMIGIANEWTNPTVLERLTLAAFLHDIGEISFPKKMFTNPKALFSPQEQELYNSHAQVGRDMLSGFDFIPEEVPTIVYQHHENSVGTGFPLGSKESHIHPLARVIALANEFCELVFPTLDPARLVRSPQDALMHIEIGIGSPFNKTFTQSLRKLVEQTSSGRKSAS